MIVPLVSIISSNTVISSTNASLQRQKQASEPGKNKSLKEWNVTASCVNGKMSYRLYRYLDDNCNDREFYPCIWDSLQQAQDFADYMN